VRPYVIGKQVKVHTLLLFFALLGGVKAFGIMGLFIGTMAVFDMLEEMNFSSPSGQRRYPSLEPRTPKAREGVSENSLST
jgi:hypothetical protein